MHHGFISITTNFTVAHHSNPRTDNSETVTSNWLIDATVDISEWQTDRRTDGRVDDGQSVVFCWSMIHRWMSSTSWLKLGRWRASCSQQRVVSLCSSSGQFYNIAHSVLPVLSPATCPSTYPCHLYSQYSEVHWRKTQQTHTLKRWKTSKLTKTWKNATHNA